MFDFLFYNHCDSTDNEAKCHTHTNRTRVVGPPSARVRTRVLEYVHVLHLYVHGPVQYTKHKPTAMHLRPATPPGISNSHIIGIIQTKSKIKNQKSKNQKTQRSGMLYQVDYLLHYGHIATKLPIAIQY